MIHIAQLPGSRRSRLAPMLTRPQPLTHSHTFAERLAGTTPIATLLCILLGVHQTDANTVQFAQTGGDAHGSWGAIPVLGPSSRDTHSAVYDSQRDRMVVFGGNADGIAQDDTWALSLGGSPSWQQLLTSGGPPPARWAHSAIYDVGHDRMIIFAGDAPTLPHYPADVWALSFQTLEWTELQPGGEEPTGWEGHSAIYDPMGDRMIVFGGDDDFNPYTNETWALSLGLQPTWTKLAIGGAPPARAFHSAIYDSIGARMVIFGGLSNVVRNDTWGLSLGSNPAWTEVVGTGGPPPARWTHSAIYDHVRNRMVVFAGHDGPAVYLDDTWALTLGGGTLWTELLPPRPCDTPPATRYGHAAVYDRIGGLTTRDRMIVVGGNDGTTDLGDTWKLSWSVSCGGAGPGPLTPPGSESGDPGTGERIALNVQTTVGSSSVLVDVVLLEAGNGSLSVFDVEGRCVGILFEGTFNAGSNPISWDPREFHGRRVASGIYLIQLRVEARTAIRKALLH